MKGETRVLEVDNVVVCAGQVSVVEDDLVVSCYLIIMLFTSDLGRYKELTHCIVVDYGRSQHSLFVLDLCAR